MARIIKIFITSLHVHICMSFIKALSLFPPQLHTPTMAVQVQTLTQFYNKLLNRHELSLLVTHPSSSFKRDDLINQLKKQYNSNYIVVQGSKTMFGTCQTRTNARVYDSKEQFSKIEDWYVLMRAGLAKKEKDSRRVRKDKRKRRMNSWGSVRRQDRKAERKQK